MTDEFNEPEPRRRWGKRLKRIALWLLAIVLLLGLALWLYREVNSYRKFQSDLVEFQGVKLGAPMAEVRYALGYPKNVLEPPKADDKFNPGPDWLYQFDVDATSGPNMMPKGTTVEQYDDWSWDRGASANTSVRFDHKTRKVTQIGCYVGDPDAFPDCWSFGTLRSGLSEEEVTALLGAPDKATYDGPSKTMEWKALGLRVNLMKKAVYMIAKSQPQGAGFYWWLSHGRP